MKQEQRIWLEIALAALILVLSMAVAFNSAISTFELTSATQDDPMYIQEEVAYSAGPGEGSLR